MAATAEVACADGCWAVQMTGEHAEQDDRDFVNEVGVPANVTDPSGDATTCSNCGAAITVSWGDD